MFYQRWEPIIKFVLFGLLGLILIFMIYFFLIKNFHRKHDNPEESGLKANEVGFREDSKNAATSERQTIQTELQESLFNIAKLIRNRKFKEAQQKLTVMKEIAEIHQFFGLLSEITRKLTICDRNIRLLERQEDLWKKFEAGNIAETYIELVELSEATQATGDKQGIHHYVSDQLLHKVKRVADEFKKDRSHTHILIERFSAMILEEKFCVALNRASITKDICKNLRFREFISPLGTLIKKAKINIEFLEQYTKNRSVYDRGKLRLSYNGMDILERKSKFAKYKPFLVDSLALKIYILFNQIRQELRGHKKALEKVLREVYRLINNQEFDLAKTNLEIAKVEARKYDFFGIIRDIENQFRDIARFEKKIMDS